MKNGRVVCIPDVHVPFQDKAAWGLALRITKALKPDYVVQLGDFADLVAVSGHDKEFGVNVSLDHELSAIQDEWGKLEVAAGRAKVVALLGNHETRLLRYVAKNASKLESIIPGFPALFRMGAKTVSVPYQEEFCIGKVHFVHDVGHAGKTATQQTLDAVGHCVVHGHTHRGAVVYDGTSDGERRFGLGCGWLGDVDAIRYMAPAKTRSWQHGIGIVDYRDGLAFAQFVPFVRGRALIDGRVFK